MRRTRRARRHKRGCAGRDRPATAPRRHDRGADRRPPNARLQGRPRPARRRRLHDIPRARHSVPRGTDTTTRTRFLVRHHGRKRMSAKVKLTTAMPAEEEWNGLDSEAAPLNNYPEGIRWALVAYDNKGSVHDTDTGVDVPRVR